MLQPTNRLTLIDALRPPTGFTLEAAMAVTFTLDLRALLAAPAAFAITGSTGASTADTGMQEPVELLHAVRANAGRITVFSQVGEIALPPSRRVFSFLERSVIPVRAPRGGVVHPKVWVLRCGRAAARDEAGEQRLRVLIASRNLTFDASWDTVIRLDETADGTGVGLAEVGGLFRGLLGAAQAEVATDHRERVEALATALDTARFALPSGVDDLRVHVLGFDGDSAPLPTAADRSLVISPFVSDDFFTTVCPVPVDELVSRPESLDLLKPETLDRIGTTYAFDDGSVTDLDADQRPLTPHDPGRPLVGLHAKVFAFEEAGRAQLFLGSANATGAAFRNNVEVLVELTGSVAHLGIDRICEGNGDELGLRALFATHSPAQGDDGEPDQDVSLDSVRRAIARLPVTGLVDEGPHGWAVTYRTEAPLPTPDEAIITCWPLASPGNRREIDPGRPLQVRFETTLETISGFLAFEIEAAGGAMTQFVVPVPLHGLPEDRDRALLRALIGNAERFLRYLLALLDEDRIGMDLLDAVETVAEGAGSDTDNVHGLPVLEKLLGTMRRDPAKLDGLHPLVADLAADDALPPGFIELWNTIREVAAAGGRPR